MPFLHFRRLLSSPVDRSRNPEVKVTGQHGPYGVPGRAPGRVPRRVPFCGPARRALTKAQIGQILTDSEKWADTATFEVRFA